MFLTRIYREKGDVAFKFCLSDGSFSKWVSACEDNSAEKVELSEMVRYTKVLVSTMKLFDGSTGLSGF